MSEQQPNPPSSNTQTILFMVVLSLVCALILSVLASVLAKPQEIAKDLDRSKQMMIAAKVLDYNGYFLMQNEKGEYIPAKALEDGTLVPGTISDIATHNQLLKVYQTRFKALLVDSQGNLKTFAESGIKDEEYLAKFKKTGYYREPLKLIYEILPNMTAEQRKTEKQTSPIGYVIPVNGYGLWDAIYGYLALKPDADTVIGISWYDQKETPGLGSNISEEPWQSLFPGKLIFQQNAAGKTDFKSAPLGIIVVKGKVSDVFGNSPKSKSAVDGMAGATLTGNGVTDAYRDVLVAYRPFLIKANEANAEKNKRV